ncbi:putative RNA-directed DNA polymerase from transposon X-element [Araneus ventricosus]|uniref:Putative RNA-directed DNA polymerase from transposon X-element n=1 Tax=Araneus ventricosus TaxID=182803 RepID=A0A4Y2HQJ5_ARAVE|nr:putative RNA-directed DNA polymerase from transposon X-element [Araneus ventricosus]
MATFRDSLDKIVVENTFDSFYQIIEDRFSTSRYLVPMLDDYGQEIGTHSKIREYILKFHFPTIDDDESLSVQSDKISEFDLITEEEIISIFEDCKNDKSPGPYGLTMGIIKEIFFDNKSLFINLLNRCLYKGIFPKVWKRANVALIPKSGKDLRLPNNYRPICLLPVWGKVLDKILAQRLSYFLEQNNKLHDLQFGFRKDRNTSLALHEVINTITTNKNNNLLTAMISLDISNAFNSVRWSDIIRILFEEEVPEYLIKMIRDFLSDRFIVDEENCFEFQYNVGVPQGSCLVPILFLLIADKLLRDLNTDDKTKVIMLADDILILTADSAVYRFSESTKIPLDKVSLG